MKCPVCGNMMKNSSLICGYFQWTCFASHTEKQVHEFEDGEWTFLRLPSHQLDMLQDLLGRVTPKGYNEKVFVSGLRALKKGNMV